MFTKIPIGKSCDMYEISVKSDLSLDTVDEFEELILRCLSDNICSFDNKVFKFPSGVPMGGSLSSSVAEVFLDRVERWALNRWSNPDNDLL